MATLFCAAHGAMAADHQLKTSVAAIYEYNDNIRLTPNNELSDSIYTVAPKLELERHHERYTARADATLEFYRYRQYDEFDDMDQKYNGLFEATPTERWQVGAEAHLSEDNRPDRDIQETGLVLSNIQRRRINAGTSAFYTFSEMTAAGLVLDFNRENFDDPEISDRKDYHVALVLTRSIDAWLARTNGRLILGYDHYEFERAFQQIDSQGVFDITTTLDDRSKVDNISLTAGTESALTEKVNLIVDLGGRYAQTQRDLQLSRIYSPPLITEVPTITDDTNDSFGFVGKVNFTYHGERTQSDMLLSHNLEPVSGSNSTVNRTTVRLSSSTRLLERLRGNLFVQWYRNENDQDDPTQDDIDRQTWNAGCGLRWALNDYVDLNASYVYTIVDNRETEITAYRNKVLIQLEAHHDWLD